MRIRFFLFVCITLIATLFPFITHGAINFTVTPIRYELELNPGESITLPASIRNNGTGTITLPTATSDFTTNGTSGTPTFVRKSELVHPDQQLSTWISIADSEVTVNAWKEVSTNFTIDVPETATPGGHYGAVFFKNPGSESTTGNIWINVDYGILVLVKVSGEIDVEVEIGEPEITNNGSSGGSYYKGSKFTTVPWNNPWYVGKNKDGDTVYQNIDECPLWDFTISKYDGLCFDNPITDNEPLLFSEDSDEPLLFEKDFEVIFKFPIKNTWNTHIKPDGKIVLKDENWNVIKAIGKKTIANERGAVIGEEIVDYIPINDQGWNILPLSQRDFDASWKGFPYKTYDDQWNQIVNYWSPSEYYTEKNKNEAGFLMFWERVSESRQHKTITADIEIIYLDENGEEVEFTVAKEFPVQYIEQKVTINPYIILFMLLSATIIIMTWIALRWWILVAKEKKCWKCKEKIKSHWKTCPYCEAIQNKKMHKKMEKVEEEKTKKTTTKKKAAPRKKSETAKKKK